MLTFSQLNSAHRLLQLSFPRQDGPAASMLVNKMTAEEELSRDFCYTLELISDHPEIELKDVQCKMVCVHLLRADHSVRYFNGYCFEFALLKVEKGLAFYQMVLKPWLAFLRLRNDHYIFHNQTITEQTKEIFLEYGMASYEMKIREGDPRRTFSSQYDESDYNYLHRRWEEMGWFYWYEHNASGHRLMLADFSPAAHPIDGDKQVAWHHSGGDNTEDKIENWSPVREVVSGKVTFSSFDFKSPSPSLVSNSSEHIQGNIHKIEVYHYRGLYAYPDSALGQLLAKKKMEQIDSAGKRFVASGNHRALQPGRSFMLSRHSRLLSFGAAPQDFEFLILSCRHQVDNNLLNADGQSAHYENRMTCVRKKIKWRPEYGFNSVDTKVPGIDTATVVGPAGEEIHTDKYGRIKVQFHWDRQGKFDEKSSCWVRVMTPWADQNFGMIAVPRTGTEVVIQYLQGNPDRPLVVGMLYNQRHMPPWSLPANKTQSGILTRSSQGGKAAHANALRFEDKKGEEEVWLHAEKDQRIEVEHDESHWVGHDRSKTVDHDETVLIKHDRSETVDHDETILIHNDRKERVDHNETISIGNDRKEDVGQDETILIGRDRKEKVGHDETIIIGHDRTETVSHNETLSVGNDRSDKVSHNDTLSVGDNRNKSVGKSESDHIGKNWKIQVGKFKIEQVNIGASQTVGMFKMSNVGIGYSLNVGAGMMTVVGVEQITKVGKTMLVSAGEHLELVCGAAKIVLRKDGGIFLQGSHIELAGSKAINADSPSIDINCGKTESPPKAENNGETLAPMSLAMAGAGG